MYRWLQEREKAWTDGDNLAIVVKSFLEGKAGEKDLHKALMNYCISQGWIGANQHWMADILAHEKEEEIND